MVFHVAIAGKFGKHCIWDMWQFNFGDNLPPRVALRLGCSTHVQVGTYICSYYNIGDFKIDTPFLDLQNCQNQASPKFPLRIFPLYNDVSQSQSLFAGVSTEGGESETEVTSGCTQSPVTALHHL